MNKILLFIFLLLPFWGIAQVRNDSTKTVFAQIVGINKNILGIGNKISVEVDFGLEKNFWGRDGRDELVDDDGKEIKFNSMVDAMNFMGRLGWRYEDSYVITIANQNVIHWLLSKEIPIDGDSRDGIRQRRDTKNKKRIVDEKSPAFDPIYD